MDVKIYRPGKNPMQSGLGRRKAWLLEFDGSPSGAPDSLMGWTQGDDTREQVRLTFSTCERAITYAKKHGWDYVVFPENYRRVKPRSYVDNFK